MAIKLIGYEHKAGTIEGTSYNNHLFHVTDSYAPGRTEVVGEQTYIIKVRDSEVQFVLGHPIDLEEIRSAIGLDLAVSFDNRGKATHISFLWKDKNGNK